MKLFDLINQRSISECKQSIYTKNLPFPHIVIDNFLKDDVAIKINEVFPTIKDDIWFEYSNPIEKKFTSDDIRKFPPLIASTISALNSESFVKELERITGINDLIADPYLHGGGLHLGKTGSKLDVHLDYSIHPKLKLERRLNLILYMVDLDYKQDWGGELELWTGKYDQAQDQYTLGNLEKTVYPKFNRAILFNTTEESFHGHPNPSKMPDGVYRKSIALYYLTEPRQNASLRQRARFIARPTDIQDPELEEFRKKRSGL